MAANPLNPSNGLPPDADTTNRINGIVLPAFALIAIIITYLPFVSFWQNRNFPAANLVIVATIANIIIFVNAIIWPDGDWSTWFNGEGYCDMLVYIRIPITTGVATSLMALTRTLLNALDVDKHNFVDTPALRRRILIIHILICWTIPIIQVGLYYVVQANRYGIIPVYGCTTMTDGTWLEILIMYPWAPLCSLVSAYQSATIIYRLRKLNMDLSTALSSSNSGYTARRYLKLLILCVLIVTVLVPVESFCLYVNIPQEMQSYSWSRTHDPKVWHLVTYLPTSAWPILQYYGWFTILLCFIIFTFFGFSDDSVDSYRKGLVVLGFGKICPSLKESREARRLRRMSLNNRSNRSSLSEQFDLVGKALKYIDNSRKRKNSQTTTFVGSECQSRKGSHATFDTLALATLTSNVSSNGNKPESAAGEPSGFQSIFEIDAITAAPSPFETVATLASIQEPEPLVAPQNRTFLTTWRTHLHLPFPFFSTPSVDKGKDVEAQTPPRKSSLSYITDPPATVSTTIWGQPFATDTNVRTPAKTHTSQLSASTLHSIGESIDPLSPKLGSRAYRERERREMERERREAREVALAKKLAENAELGGVVVKTISLEVREEGPSSSKQ